MPAEIHQWLEHGESCPFCDPAEFHHWREHGKGTPAEPHRWREHGQGGPAPLIEPFDRL